MLETPFAWIRYWVGKALPPRRLTVDDLGRGARIRWGWRATEIRDATSEVIAHTPRPSKPGHIGSFPVSEENQ